MNNLLQQKFDSLKYVQEFRDFRTFLVKMDYTLGTDNRQLLREIDKKVVELKMPKNASLRKFLVKYNLTYSQLKRHVKLLLTDEMFEKLVNSEELDASAKILLRTWRKRYTEGAGTLEL